MIPIAIAAVYLIVFLVKLPHNVRELGWISDYASGFTVPEALVKTGTAGHTVLASSGQWVSLWFGLLTARLPLHRELWAVAPTALFIITALTIGWSVAQLAGRRAAVLAVLMVLVASPVALAIFMAAVNHNTLYPATALAGAYLLWLARGERARRRAIAIGAPLFVGIALGACLASDLLVLATAVLPLLLTAILAALRREQLARTIALSALASAILSIPVAILTSAAMKSAGFVVLPTPFKLAPLAELGTQARFLFYGLESLFDGTLAQVAPGALHSVLEVACDILLVGALLALLVVGARTAVSFLATARRRSSAMTRSGLALSLHVIYWVGSAVGACAAVWLTAEMSPADLHESYYATVILSVAAILPLLISRRPLVRWLIIAGVSIFFAASLAGLAGRHKSFPLSIARYESQIVRIAQANHVVAGYAGYWDASSLTWSTANRVVVRPVMACRSPTGVDVCPFYMERVPAWYVPQRRRTFLLVDSAEVWLSGLPEGLGRPLAAYAFGPMRMYVYPYDIASRLGPAVSF